MNLQVNANLALELPPDLACPAPDPEKRTDRGVELAAQFIPAGARVFDLSEGTALQALLPNGCSYRGIDRPLAAFIRDLKSGDFPTRAATDCDVIVMLGVLERTTDVENLFTHLRFCRHDIILSYCATDLTNGVDRAALGFANHLSFYELARLFDRYGFRIECMTPIDETQVLMRLKPSEWLSAPAASSVAVISTDDAGDFGARLGRQMVNALLPGEAEVHHLNLRTLGEARGGYDLVVLGTGNGLFPTLLGEQVLEIVSHAKAAIGIFGTHSRELIARPAFDRLIDRHLARINGASVAGLDAAGAEAPSSINSSRRNSAVGALPIASTAPASRSAHSSTPAAERVLCRRAATPAARGSATSDTTSLPASENHIAFPASVSTIRATGTTATPMSCASRSFYCRDE